VKTLETYEERKAFVEELKQQWKTLWRERIDDEVRAEGISSKDYLELFVERGTVIVATRKFKPLDFYDIVHQHLSLSPSDINSVLPSPRTGGWGKFVRNVLSKQQSSVRRRRSGLIENDKKLSQQMKKCGRGWLHFRKGQV
jgi:hypothetical protein